MSERVYAGTLFNRGGTRAGYAARRPDPDPADYCPLGHGPMWYWPMGGTWACQNVHCGQRVPVPEHLVLDLSRARDQIMPEHTIDAARYMTAHWATSYSYGATVTPPTARLFVTNVY